MKSFSNLILAFLLFFTFQKTKACSIVYYIDAATGKIYIANNEDYWYATKAYTKSTPRSKNKLARIWFGWKDFAQGGINEAGLFFDAAVTPKQILPKGYKQPNGRNIGDEILAKCKTVEEAINYLEKEKIALDNSHLFFGDAHGNAVVLEWVSGIKKIVSIENNVLIATNFLLSAPNEGNYPCYRYNSIEKRIENLKKETNPITFLQFGNVIGGAAQTPQKNNEGKIGGTLYTSFINITDMELIIIPKLKNENFLKINLKKEFEKNRKKKRRF